ncbi:MAG: hypothetical protein R3282_00120, partial [Rhodothermales bacterium]|nr:hypothetical protein [Rhodothermales bacterium]
METDLARTLFDSARERYEGAGRWTGIVILVLLIFHIAAFHPFVSASRALDTARAETNVLEATAPRMEAMRKALVELAGTSEKQIEAVVHRLLDAKIEDFQALSRKVQVVRGDAQPEPTSPMMLQMAPGAVQQIRTELPAFDADLEANVRHAR